MSTTGIKVAIGAEFLTAFAQLPSQQQGKVSQFLEKFRANPTATGIHYEKIHGAKDPNLRSVRIDQTYRGIVLRPAQGNVYVLLWVDHFDAMIIVGANDGVIPLAAAASEVDSAYARVEFETKERSLLYVAATRAKNHVLITCNGTPSPFTGVV